MLKLTDEDDGVIYISPRSISAIKVLPHGSRIELWYCTYIVQESAEAILAMPEMLQALHPGYIVPQMKAV
jgi:hypothetical protein